MSPADQSAVLHRGLELVRDELGYDLADRGLQDLDGFLKLFGFDTVRAGDDIVALEFDDPSAPDISRCGAARLIRFGRGGWIAREPAADSRSTLAG